MVRHCPHAWLETRPSLLHIAQPSCTRASCPWRCETCVPNGSKSDSIRMNEEQLDDHALWTSWAQWWLTGCGSPDATSQRLAGHSLFGTGMLPSCKSSLAGKKLFKNSKSILCVQFSFSAWSEWCYIALLVDPVIRKANKVWLIRQEMKKASSVHRVC